MITSPLLSNRGAKPPTAAPGAGASAPAAPNPLTPFVNASPKPLVGKAGGPSPYIAVGGSGGTGWGTQTARQYDPSKVDLKAFGQFMTANTKPKGVGSYDPTTNISTGGLPIYDLMAKANAGGELSDTELAFLASQQIGAGSSAGIDTIRARNNADGSTEYYNDDSIRSVNGVPTSADWKQIDARKAAGGYDANGQPIDLPKATPPLTDADRALGYTDASWAALNDQIAREEGRAPAPATRSTADQTPLGDALPFDPTGRMIPSTANPAQTPQAQGPNPLIPFYSGQGVGFPGGGVGAPGGPQIPSTEGATAEPIAFPDNGWTPMMQTIDMPDGTGSQGGIGDTDPAGGMGGGMGLPPNSPQFGGPQAPSSGGFGVGAAASGGSGMRAGGTAAHGFQRYLPVGYPSGRDPRKRRPLGGDDRFAPLGPQASDPSGILGDLAL